PLPIPNFRVSRARLKCLESSLLFPLNIEELIEFGNFEHFIYLRVDVAKHQSPVDLLQFLIKRNQFGQGRAGEIFHVAEIQQDLAPPRVFNQAKKLLTNDLNVLLVQNLAIDEIDDGHVADVFHFKATATRLCRHTRTPWDSSSGLLWPGMQSQL